MGGNTARRFESERAVKGFGPITQLGYLTDDLDKTAKIWTSLGVGPFMRMSNVVMPATMDGQTVDIKIDLGLAYKDDVQIELIQPLCDSPSPYQTYKQAGIWGAHHTQFTVTNLDGAISKCEAVGMDMACEITSAGSRYIYMRGQAGWIELTVSNPTVQPLFDMIKANCQNWDGETVFQTMG